MTLFSALSFVLIGILSGFFAGLLGISGGVVAVPLLVLIFSKMGFPPEDLMRFAIGTSLASMVFNTFSSTWAYNRKGAVLWDIFRRLLPGIILGSFLGAAIARFLSGDMLEKIFGGFQILLGIYFLFPSRAPSAEKLPPKILLTFIAVVISAVSNILGIGGGILVVPALLFFHIPTYKAIGTASASGFVVSLFGALSYLYIGLKNEPFPHSFGYLYIPAFLIIGVVSFLIAPIGTKVAHKISVDLLKKIFACVLIIVGIVMIT